MGVEGRAVANGGNIFLNAEEPHDLARRILDRVVKNPDSVVRSYRDDGNHQTQSRADLWRRSSHIAAALARAGAAQSTPVVILADDILDFLPAFWACLRGAFIAVPLMGAAKDASYRGERAFDTALSLLPGYIVLADDAFAAIAEDLTKSRPGNVISLSLVVPDETWVDRGLVSDPPCLIGTSGSTGRLKLVAVAHSALIFRNYDSAREPNPIGSHALVTFPFDTVTGQHAIYLHTDSLTQIPPKTMTSRPTAVLDAIEQLRVSRLSLTSSTVGRILGDEGRGSGLRDLSSLESIGIGAEPITIRLIQDFAKLLERYGGKSNLLAAGYGTTETGAITVGSSDFLTASPLSPVCLGPPRAGIQMRLVDEDHSILGLGEIGELEVFCPEKIFSGYWGDPDLTRDSFTADGWWKTGDLGQLADGQFFLHGRVKEVFIQNGRKFSFADIDNEMQNSLHAGDVAHAFSAPLPGHADQLAVLFAVSKPSRAEGVSDTIRTALARRFGLYPGFVFETESQLIPKTAAGKLRRGLLNGLLHVSLSEKRTELLSGHHVGGIALLSRERLETIWNTALGIDGPVTLDANFLDSGGDSLRSLSLHHQIIDAFSVHISSEEFFADPTFEKLLRLVENRHAASDGIYSNSEIRWPLPRVLNSNLMSALETWEGKRFTKARTMVTYNSGGTKPPLFWVFNAYHELPKLSAALGPDQPLYAFRSGYQICYNEDDIQALALRYLSDIVEVCPEGPFFVGGNCQGAITALAIAQHALRRKRHVPVLFLMDWSFELQPFSGHVVLISGCDNFDHNPMRRFVRPDLAWQRAFASYEFAEIPGGYAQGFEKGNIETLTNVLKSRMRSALSESSTLLPASEYRATIEVHDLPQIMKIGDGATIKVIIRQNSDIAWRETEQSGIVVGSRWLDANGVLLKKMSSTAKLRQMAPRSSDAVDLVILAPDVAGKYTLNIELCEEGNKWFAKPQAGFCTSMSVVSSNILPLKPLWWLLRAIRNWRI